MRPAFLKKRRENREEARKIELASLKQSVAITRRHNTDLLEEMRELREKNKNLHEKLKRFEQAEADWFRYLKFYKQKHIEKLKQHKPDIPIVIRTHVMERAFDPLEVLEANVPALVTDLIRKEITRELLEILEKEICFEMIPFAGFGNKIRGTVHTIRDDSAEIIQNALAFAEIAFTLLDDDPDEGGN